MWYRRRVAEGLAVHPAHESERPSLLCHPRVVLVKVSQRLALSHRFPLFGQALCSDWRRISQRLHQSENPLARRGVARDTASRARRTGAPVAACSCCGAAALLLTL